ncbi:hypothetical protein EVAR_99926_1 [Eumeta japonica]|uniref:Uncharacterized protein n=1 Tax=Eumeta variegata TaxID=151549 RepID=A0A4C1YWK3_EUMVA|nr:hypothetical protein EVAR_99926_1 [Eumeta japonica]
MLNGSLLPQLVMRNIVSIKRCDNRSINNKKSTYSFGCFCCPRVPILRDGCLKERQTTAGDALRPVLHLRGRQTYLYGGVYDASVAVDRCRRRHNYTRARSNAALPF